jgi:hypothetical protein
VLPLNLLLHDVTPRRSTNPAPLSQDELDWELSLDGFCPHRVDFYDPCRECDPQDLRLTS